MDNKRENKDADSSGKEKHKIKSVTDGGAFAMAMAVLAPAVILIGSLFSTRKKK